MVVFGSVIYPGAEAYFDEFTNSINNQDDKDFDIIIINDGVDKQTVANLQASIKPKVNIIDSNSSKTPAQLRVELILQAKKRDYSFLILGDCDDTFASDRLRRNVTQYKKNNEYAFFYNELRLSDGSLCFDMLPETTTMLENILQYNYLGLSNSALNIRLLDLDFIKSLYEFDSFVFDWYLFSRILLAGGKGMLVNNTYTTYRIHEGNFAGVGSISVDGIRKEIEVKRKHYRCLSQFSERAALLHEQIKKIRPEEVVINEDRPTYWWSSIKI